MLALVGVALVGVVVVVAFMVMVVTFMVVVVAFVCVSRMVVMMMVGKFRIIIAPASAKGH